MSIIRRWNKTTYRIAACIIAAIIAASPAAVGIRADAAEEESSEDKDGKKQEKDRKEDASEAPAEGSTKGSAEAASIEEPKTPEEEEPRKEEPAHPESSVREALDHERSMVADDDILLVRIGYEFDDGSFDEWMRGTGFIVGPRYILTRQSLIDTASDSALFARIVKERGEAYRRVGVNLLTGEEAAKHVRYYVNDREGNRLEVTDLSMKSGLGLVVTKEVMDIPACVFTKVNEDDLAEGTVIHTKTAAETGEQFTFTRGGKWSMIKLEGDPESVDDSLLNDLEDQIQYDRPGKRQKQERRVSDEYAGLSADCRIDNGLAQDCCPDLQKRFSRIGDRQVCDRPVMALELYMDPSERLQILCLVTLR